MLCIRCKIQKGGQLLYLINNTHYKSKKQSAATRKKTNNILLLSKFNIYRYEKIKRQPRAR